MLFLHHFFEYNPIAGISVKGCLWSSQLNESCRCLNIQSLVSIVIKAYSFKVFLEFLLPISFSPKPANKEFLSGHKEGIFRSYKTSLKLYRIDMRSFQEKNVTS